jgi:hypothetical protein
MYVVPVSSPPLSITYRAVIGGGYTHWSMITHPLGVATDNIFSGPGYDFWVPGAEGHDVESGNGPLESGDLALPGRAGGNNTGLVHSQAQDEEMEGSPTDPKSTELPRKGLSHTTTVQMPNTESKSEGLEQGTTTSQVAWSGQVRAVEQAYAASQPTAGKRGLRDATKTQSESPVQGLVSVPPFMAPMQPSPEGLGPLASGLGIGIGQLKAEAQAHSHRASRASVHPLGSSPLPVDMHMSLGVPTSPTGTKPPHELKEAVQHMQPEHSSKVSFALPVGFKSEPSSANSILAAAAAAVEEQSEHPHEMQPQGAVGSCAQQLSALSESATTEASNAGAERPTPHTGVAARAPPPPLHIERPARSVSSMIMGKGHG